MYRVNFIRLNIIVTFQAEFNVGHITSEISLFLSTVRNQNCSFFLTSLSSLQAADNIKTLEELFGNVQCLMNNTSYFESKRPYREAEIGHLCYRNKYVILYQSLYEQNLHSILKD